MCMDNRLQRTYNFSLLTIFSGQSTRGIFVAGLEDDGVRTRRTGTTGGGGAFAAADCCCCSSATAGDGAGVEENCGADVAGKLPLVLLTSTDRASDAVSSELFAFVADLRGRELSSAAWSPTPDVPDRPSDE